MAANVDICSSLLAKMQIIAFLSTLTFCLLTGVNGTTTQAPNTTTVAATNATTNTQAATTTTTQAPTTTTTPLPTTTTIAPNQPRTEIGETVLGQCLCDLTGNNCDVNCCCDTDCSAEEIQNVFDCNPVSVTVDDKLCYQEDIFIFSNSPETTRTEGDLFCIVFDNYKERNFYLDPNFILDFPTFNNYLDRYATPTFQGIRQFPERVYDLNSFYVSGDAIFIVYPNDSVGQLVFPVSTASSLCNDQNPMAYLQDETSSCTRNIASPLTQQTCETSTPAFIAGSYYSGFRVVKTPGLFGYVENGTLVEITTPAPVTTAGTTTTTVAATTVNGTTTAGTTVVTTTVSTTTTPPPLVNVTDVQSLFDNPYTLNVTLASQHLCLQEDGTISACSFTGTPSPTYTVNTGICANIVLQARYTVVTEGTTVIQSMQARYTVVTDGTTGIESMQVQFVFANITSANSTIEQTFSATFNSVLDNPNITNTEKSGNPGYLQGKPLLYGTLNSTTDVDGVTTQFIERATDPTLGLTVVRATGTGECSTATSMRKPLQFGENMRTGCLVRLTLSAITSQICRDIQEAIINALEGPNAPTYDPVSVCLNMGLFKGISVSQTHLVSQVFGIRLTLSAITSQICRDIQEAIINALEGPNAPTYDPVLDVWIDNNRYVGTFGNTDVNQVGDWVKVISSDRPILDDVVAIGTPADTCRLSMGMHIQVLYSSVGALALPQRKIIGVAILYDSVQNIKYRCTGAFCTAGSTGQEQVFEVSQTVSFVDVSQPAVKYAGEAPIFIARVPNDFFYPFLYYTNSATSISSVNCLIGFVSMLVTLMNLRLGF